MKEKQIIGRLEYVNIPELNITGVSAKIDTGAYRGSIHASNIKEIERDGKKFLTFTLLDSDHNEYDGKVYEVDEYTTGKFRGTQVDYHERYVIPVTLEIAGKRIKTQLSLSDRKDLRFPILIGRKPLKRKFLINPARTYIHR